MKVYLLPYSSLPPTQTPAHVRRRHRRIPRPRRRRPATAAVFYPRHHSSPLSTSRRGAGPIAVRFAQPAPWWSGGLSELRRQVWCFSTGLAAAESDAPSSSDASVKIPPDDRIPATIITGFLGSGKTTLLNYILTANHGKRIAMIENEFGEVGIDGSLVAAQKAGTEDIMVLNNGCICCTVRGDLVRMIAELVERKKGKFDHIVIETTGLANPSPIIQTFYAEDKVFNDVKLDGVVTLVDAKHAGFHLDEVKPKGVVNEAVEQIAYADQIIVNKIDLVDEPQISNPIITSLVSPFDYQKINHRLT